MFSVICKTSFEAFVDGIILFSFCAVRQETRVLNSAVENTTELFSQYLMQKQIYDFDYLVI